MLSPAVCKYSPPWVGCCRAACVVEMSYSRNTSFRSWQSIYFTSFISDIGLSHKVPQVFDIVPVFSIGRQSQRWALGIIYTAKYIYRQDNCALSQVSTTFVFWSYDFRKFSVNILFSISIFYMFFLLYLIVLHTLKLPSNSHDPLYDPRQFLCVFFLHGETITKVGPGYHLYRYTIHI